MQKLNFEQLDKYRKGQLNEHEKELVYNSVRAWVTKAVGFASERDELTLLFFKNLFFRPQDDVAKCFARFLKIKPRLNYHLRLERNSIGVGTCKQRDTKPFPVIRSIINYGGEKFFSIKGAIGYHVLYFDPLGIYLESMLNTDIMSDWGSGNSLSNYRLEESFSWNSPIGMSFIRFLLHRILISGKGLNISPTSILLFRCGVYSRSFALEESE